MPELEAYVSRQRGFGHVAGAQAPHNNTDEAYGMRPTYTEEESRDRNQRQLNPHAQQHQSTARQYIFLAHLRTQGGESLGRSAAHSGLAVPQACLQQGQQLPSTQQNHALVHTHCQGGQGLRAKSTKHKNGEGQYARRTVTARGQGSLPVFTFTHAHTHRHCSAA